MLRISNQIAITPEGKLLIAGTPSFAISLGYPNPDFDVTAYAVRNLGFVLITWIEDDAVEVHFRASLLTRFGIDESCRFILKQKPDRIRLRYPVEDGELRPSSPLFVFLNRIRLAVSAEKFATIEHAPY